MASGYRNVHIHDSISGTLAVQRKEQLRQKIEECLDIAEDEIAEEDKYLLDIDLESLDTSSGESQECWLMALETAVESSRLGRALRTNIAADRRRTRRA